MRFLGVSIVAAMVAASSASAVLVQFDNSAGQFVMGLSHEGAGGRVYLDVTKSPTDQTTLYTPSSVLFDEVSPRLQQRPGRVVVHGRITAGVNTIDQISFTTPGERVPVTFSNVIRTISAGETIGPGQEFGLNPYVEYIQSPSINQTWLYSKSWFDNGGTVGMKFEIDGQTHYGFIEFGPRAYRGYNFNEYQPIRWGYETEANTGFVVPAPAASAMLMLGGCLAARRRRTRSA